MCTKIILFKYLFILNNINGILTTYFKKYDQIDWQNYFKGNDSIKRIYLNNNKIENIEPISNFSKLIFLELNNNKITNIESIIHLVNLIEIHVGFNDITRFNFSPKLRNMFIDMNQVDVFHQKSNNRISSKKTKSI